MKATKIEKRIETQQKRQDAATRALWQAKRQAAHKAFRFFAKRFWEPYELAALEHAAFADQRKVHAAKLRLQAERLKLQALKVELAAVTC